ncbi:MAG: tRNA (adenosine(37)-N6)-dimethylallyltransferase MiaA [Planctomycetota bacterium]
MTLFNENPPPLVRVLCGPTASGKSAVGVYLARRLNAEILSIDSMKIYRRLNIGTAKPPPETLAATRHHLIDVREPWESFSVAEFLRESETLIADCAARGVNLIGEGGTALYLKALCEGLFAGPGRDLNLRENLEAEARMIGAQKLHERLAALDPPAAARIMPSDLRRIIRALEVVTLTGKPISQWQSQWGMPRHDLDVRLACLTLPRQTLYSRIDARVDCMLNDGWLEECRTLLEMSRPLSREVSQSLGYRTLLAHLNGLLTLPEARDRICFDTHHFARRQLNWFKHLPKIVFVEVAENEDLMQIAERVIDAWGG